MKIAIDKGHNRGQDIGAVAIGNENTMNIETGDKVISKLKSLGYDVLDVINNIGNDVSVGESLGARVSIANNWGADLYVSIHANAGGGTGTEVWCGSSSSVDIATRITENIADAFGYRNRGVKIQGQDGYGHLYVLNNTNMPALLVEQCFVDSQDDMNKWDSEKMANAIVKGITGQVVEDATPVQPVKSTVPKYDVTIPDGVFSIIGTNGYFEQAKDGRLIIHKDRGNYIAIGQGFIDIYWNDNNGHGGSKRLSN
ncbi:N-acetylmuramoyl-L-alanine amidase [Clostridium sp. JS66]|uniref:N-acetylmuramoyl-L-alanine amidase n=1 Tax=Clostridium sp. JS66 TaxID=3064705 RepID=UPI00298DC0E8|nr:N-acetylmuramoyl-L-alanine amidase [Clostridium sp. JS66]WPC42981.1 N-acetylmuramoyl-L-alanine amidase [Clostridium sp. JS66]